MFGRCSVGPCIGKCPVHHRTGEIATGRDRARLSPRTPPERSMQTWWGNLLAFTANLSCCDLQKLVLVHRESLPCHSQVRSTGSAFGVTRESLPSKIWGALRQIDFEYRASGFLRHSTRSTQLTLSSSNNLKQRSKKIAEVRNAPFVPIGRVGHGETDRTVTGFMFRGTFGLLPKHHGHFVFS